MHFVELDFEIARGIRLTEIISFEDADYDNRNDDDIHYVNNGKDTFAIMI